MHYGIVRRDPLHMIVTEHLVEQVYRVVAYKSFVFLMDQLSPLLCHVVADIRFGEASWFVLAVKVIALFVCIGKQSVSAQLLRYAP